MTNTPNIHCTHHNSDAHNTGKQSGYACIMLTDGRHGVLRFVKYHNSDDFSYSLVGFGASSGSNFGWASLRATADVTEEQIMRALAASPEYRRAFTESCKEYRGRDGWKPPYVGNVTF